MKIPNFSSRKNRHGTVYYRYRYPDGTFEALGTDERVAVKVALQLNDEREEVPRTLGKSSVKTMAYVIDQFLPVKLRLSKSESYRKEVTRRLTRLKERMGTWSVSEVSIASLDDLFDVYYLTYEGYRTNRILVGELMTYAIGRGWRLSTYGNPGKDMLPPLLAREKGSKRRRRLTLTQFKAIYAEAAPWLQIAMDLALRFGIRRADVCALTFKNVTDTHLRFIPQKTQDLPTPAAISIPLDDDLRAIIARAKAMAPLSPYIVHRNNSFQRTAQATERKHITQVIPEQLTRHFKTTRDRTKAFPGYREEELPGYHEIRSLCARLYQEQGRSIEEVQLLLGHGNVDMTEWYQTDPSRVQWQEVRAGLVI